VQTITEFFTNPAVWIALTIGIAATLLTSPVARLLRAVVMFVPRRIGSGFSDMLKFAPILNKARGDVLAGVAYIGAELGSLVLNCTLALLAVGFYYAIVTTSSSWVVTYRTVLLIITVIALIVFVFHIVKRLVLLRLLYMLILTPPDANAKVTVGDPKKPGLNVGPAATTAAPAAQTSGPATPPVAPPPPKPNPPTSSN
jgi:hypothetical protein